MISITEENRRWWILGAMGGVMSIILLDETVVGVALPTMQRDLALSHVGAHWVINSYLLVFTVLAAAGGKLGDTLGHRALFVVGVVLFGLSSLACGFSGNAPSIMSARALQGVGAAIVFPLSFAMITVVFPPEQRGVAFGIFSAVGSAALAVGPLAGGFFTDTLSWRWVFWINPPIVVVIAFIVLRAWREPARDGPSESLDVPGLAALSLGLGMVVVGLMQGPEWGWSHPAILALLVGGPAMLILFAVVERRRAMPLLDVTLFAGGTFSVSNFNIFTAQFNQMAIVVFGALYFQHVLHMSPLLAGLALLIAVGAVPLTAVPTGRLTDRIGARRVMLGGLALAAASLSWLGIAVLWENYLLLAPGLVGWGASNAALFVAPRHAIMNGIAPAKQGQASGISMTGQLLGGTMAVAACGTILAMTFNFTAVFLFPAGLSLLVLFLTWLCVKVR